SCFSDGCIYYKSICTDRDAINRINGEIKTLKKTYDAEYVKSATDWVNLRDSNNHNAYIQFYVDDTIKKVQTLKDLQTLATDKLELKVPLLFARFQASKNMTSEQYLQTLVDDLEYSVDDIKKILKAQRDNEIIGLLVQVLVEGALNTFTKSYKKAYNEIRLRDKLTLHKSALLTAMFKASPADAKILSDPLHPEYENTLKKYNLESGKITTFGRFKLTPKVFGQMFSNAKKYVSNKLASLKEWTTIDSWDGFKTKVKSTLQSPIAKLNAVKAFVTNSASRKYTVKNFKMDWSTRIMTGVGAAVDIITQAISVSEWKKVADQMAKTRRDYENFKTELQNQINAIKAEQKNVTAEWTRIVSVFKGLSQAFNSLIQNTAKNSDFADVLGLPRLPVNPKNPIVSIQFDSLTKSTVAAAQTKVVNFLKSNNNDLDKVNDQMNARVTLYTSVLNKTEKKEVVTEMLSDLKTIYSFKASATEKAYGVALAKKDVVCVAAVLLKDKTVYDYYSLTSFRPRCDVSTSAFATMDANAADQRKRENLVAIVKSEVTKQSNITLASLLSKVKTAYSVLKDATLKAYGNKIQEKDIVCQVATEFQSMQVFDLIDLPPFRPSCSAVSDAQFATMKQDATDKRTLDGKVTQNLDICDNFKFCPCVAMMASSYSTTDAKILASIKRLKPTMAQYCSTTGCACVNL
ncbi:hypothetical protein FSP39_013618, partial [Pinctada imbricata]